MTVIDESDAALSQKMRQSFLKQAFRLSVGILLTTVLVSALSLWIINSSFIYNPRKEFARFTNIVLSSEASIDRFSVRNFFYLDGPDFFYELTLSLEDKRKLIKLFDDKGADISDDRAMQLVPFSWIGGDRKLKRYYMWNTWAAPDAGIYLDIDSDSNKAWFVIQIY